MNNKKQITKVSVLIDKLNYLNNNLDLNTLKINDLDFQLLKNYTAELWQVLQTVSHDDTLVQQNQPVKEQLFDQLPKVEPPIIKKPLKPAFSNPVEPQANFIHPTPKKKDNEIVIPKNEAPLAKKELDKNPTDNIFDTVKAIKKQHNIEVEPKAKIEPPAFQKISPTVPASVEKEIQIHKQIHIEEEQEEVQVQEHEHEQVQERVQVQVDEQVQERVQVQEEENVNPSLNDRFKKPKETLATVIKTNSSRNFKDLIDINDRFLFIQSLFGGSYLAFEEAIKQINKIESYSEALDYVDYKLKGTYDWSTDSTEVTKFLNILERSYAF